MAERQETVIQPLLPVRLNHLKRLQEIHRQQPKAAVGDVALGQPVDLVVLATKNTGATCRLARGTHVCTWIYGQGRGGVLTLRANLRLDVVPGRIVTVIPEEVWSHAGRCYLGGYQMAVRFEPAALGLTPLALKDWDPWDPEDHYWGEDGEPLEPWARRIFARGPRPSFVFEPCRPGRDPEDYGSDPIYEAVDSFERGDSVHALRLLEAVCQADLRCLDAHAHLGTYWFGHRPEVAFWHFEVGYGIGQLSLGPAFDGVLLWSCLDNRPFLRCMHGYGLCLWRLGRFREAKRIFERMLWMNPSDNQGVRFLLRAVRAKRNWSDLTEEGAGW